MPRHTPPPPVAVGDLFPELAPLRRSTLRLHPRGGGSPRATESSMGGPLLWPAGEPWPSCDGEHFNSDGDSPEEDTVYEAPVALVPVVQLHAGDSPGGPFPPGRDLLQVLWCPFNHGELYDRCPLPRVYWRNAGAVQQVRPSPGPNQAAPAGNVPAPCAVHPEQVSEYPMWDDIPEELKERIGDRLRRLPEETGWDYFHHLSAAPGTKLGGWPLWSQGFGWPDCESCGQPMHHLLTVDSSEFDGESWRTWLPEEDRPAAGSKADWSAVLTQTVPRPASLDLGDGGKIYLFECLSCPDRPLQHRFDFG